MKQLIRHILREHTNEFLFEEERIDNLFKGYILAKKLYPEIKKIISENLEKILYKIDVKEEESKHNSTFFPIPIFHIRVFTYIEKPEQIEQIKNDIDEVVSKYLVGITKESLPILVTFYYMDFAPHQTFKEYPSTLTFDHKKSTKKDSLETKLGNFVNSPEVKPNEVDYIQTEIGKVGDNKYKMTILYYFPTGTNIRQYNTNMWEWNSQILNKVKNHFNIDVEIGGYGLRRH
jgi:hypothetical protein